MVRGVERIPYFVEAASCGICSPSPEAIAGGISASALADGPDMGWRDILAGSGQVNLTTTTLRADPVH
jgi:hypothetical protein